MEPELRKSGRRLCVDRLGSTPRAQGDVALSRLTLASIVFKNRSQVRVNVRLGLLASLFSESSGLGGRGLSLIQHLMAETVSLEPY